MNNYDYNYKTNNTFDLSRDCTLVGIEVGLYPWAVKDETAARNAAGAERADSNRYSTYIQRLGKEDRLPPQQIASVARKIIAFPNGTPWDGKGMFLVPNQRLETVLTLLKAEQDKFYQAVEGLANAIPALAAKAQRDLGDAFNRIGFPTPEDIRSKYRFSIRQSAITSADDIRLNHVSPKMRHAIEESVRKEHQQQMDDVHASCVAGIESVLKRVVETLPAFSKGEITRFENTLITSMAELCETLPLLNFSKDKTVEIALGQMRGLVAQLMGGATTTTTTTDEHGNNIATTPAVSLIPTIREKSAEGDKVRANISKEARSILAILKNGGVSNKI